uniref:GTPase IMAP family member 4-like n=1 Tax=Crassostrea virginica TaxID=6565 RepID=A0A8B8AKD9_CRAVI|nr:GTPase IMAP family member 4-like [Crassostrea virginica]
MESFLKSIGKERHLDAFNKNEITLDLLKTLSRENLEKTLTLLNLNVGTFMSIIDAVETLKIKGAVNEVVKPIGNNEIIDGRMEISSPKDVMGREKQEMWDFSEVCPAEREVRLVLLGKTGSGKSASGNSILGLQAFKSNLSGISITRTCSQKFANRFNRKIIVVDTPGIFDTEETNEKIQQEIHKCIGITSPGPHAFIMVISIANRFTEEEQRTVDHFVRHFGENIYKYFFVLFTRQDELERHNINLHDHIRDSPPNLRLFIKRCGGKVFAIDNTLAGNRQDQQVGKLLSEIFRNLEQNGYDYYTDEMYQEAERKIQEIENEMKKRDEEQRIKEMQEIEKRLEKKYKEKLQQEIDKINSLTFELTELRKNQAEREYEVKNLMKVVDAKEKQISECPGAENEEDMQTLDLLRNELAELKDATAKGERKIAEIEKAKNEAEEKNAQIIEKQKQELEDTRREYDRKQDDMYREEIRHQIEMQMALPKQIWDTVKSVGGFLKSIFGR